MPCSLLFPSRFPRCGYPHPGPSGSPTAPSFPEPILGYLVHHALDGHAAVLDAFSGEIVTRAAQSRRFPFAGAALDPVVVLPDNPNWDPTTATSRENAMRLSHLRQLMADQNAPSEGWIFRE